MKTRTLLTMLVLGATAALALDVGRTCFSKKASTALLAEPDRYASTVVTVEWGKPLSIVGVEGRWLNVTSDNRKGWVYAGNVTSIKPPTENKNDLLPATAGETTAAVAARPLSDSSKQFAERKSLAAAAADVEWAEAQAALVTEEKVDAYMQQNKLGDYGE